MLLAAVQRLTADGDLKCQINSDVTNRSHTPAPVVVTTLALLLAPSPLVVYAATVTEYVVSGNRPVMMAS